MPEQNINQLPKVFADNILVGFTEEAFVIGVFSGANVNTYAITPAHTKRLMQYLAHNVTEYTNKYGEISGFDWSPIAQSPVQIKDLK